MIIEGGTVLTPQGFVRCDIGISDGVIVDPSEADGNRRCRAHGMHVLPGIIDIHGDAFERQIMPRPGVSFDHDIALMDTDRQLAANGITTAYHGITLSWEPGLRSTQSAIAIMAAIERLRPSFAVDTRIHLRHETFHLDAEPAIMAWLEAGRLGCLAFNDHTSGTILVRQRPDKIGKMVERSGLTHGDFMTLVERVAAREDEVAPSLARLSTVASANHVPLLSHDDMSPGMRADFRALGATIAEFPIDVDTTEAAAAAADHIVFGAPNVLRGGSHTGCPSAREMIGRSLCTILASDYYYPSLLHAPYLLQKLGIAPFEKAWALVTTGPAAALGLKDRGIIEEGRRADMIIVDLAPASGPAVAATLIGGRIALSKDPVRITG